MAESRGNVAEDGFGEHKKSERNQTAEVALGQLSSNGAPKHLGYGNEDDEAQKWAALERLPTTDRVRTAILNKAVGDGKFEAEEVPVHEMTKEQRFEIVERALEVHGQDNEVFCRKMKQRLDRAGVKFPTVEVKFANINVEAKVRVGSRALPTLLNFVRNLSESILVKFKIVPDRRKDFPILNNVNGVLKPGRMTLLLGPPGAGKSTLMKFLSGKSDKSLLQTGDVTYNGHDMSEFIPTRTASYISQQDLHLGELTVRETLDFSARLQGSGSRVDMVAELERREKELGIKPDPHMDAFMKAMAVEGNSSHVVTDLFLRLLGLDVVSDTLVGNDMVRGVSGGQKKRVTTGEMVVGAKQVLYMDEISTGLDSSTTFMITQCLRNFTHTQDATVLIALLQPAPETYDLFDDILLLAEGHVVFHGPREEVVPFFEAQGFKSPERKGTADFLQEVTSLKDQGQYWSVKDSPYRYVPVATFAEAFEATPRGRQIVSDLATPYPKEQSLPGALVSEEFALPKMELFKAVYYREAMLMKRNAFLYIALTVQMAIVSLISSAVFFRTRMHETVADSNFFLGALFFGLVLVLFNGFAEMSLLIERMPVFYKQRDMKMFPAWTWVVPLWTLSIPFSVFACFVWVGINYYIIGFAPQAGRFFTQILIYVLLHQMGIALFRFIGAVARHIVLANTFGAFGIIVLFVLGGFIIAKNDIHPYWIWGFWVSPVAYIMEGLVLNEFLAERWQKPANQTVFPGQTVGHVVIHQRDFFRSNYLLWVGCAAVVFSIVLFNVLCILALQYLDPLGDAQPLLSEDVLEVKHAARTGQNLASVSGVRNSRSRRGGSRRTPPGPSGVGTPQLSALDNYLAQSMLKQPSKLGRGSTLDAAKRSLQQRSGLGPETLQSMSGLGAQSGLGATSGAVQDSSTLKQGSHLASASGLSAKEKKLQSESALSAAAAALQEAGVLGKKGMVLPFVPLALSFHHVNYFVPMPAEMKAANNNESRLQLLRDVSGAFRPGVLTALVGVSGAGKTTLMDVLAGRKTGGTIEGDIRVSGYPKVPETFARIMGYCEQFDIHSPQVTVYESLLYSALLRLPKEVDRETREEFVEEVMELVEMAPLREALVGLPGVTGLSTEQRKRLTIAVELVANPSIIFMDEPTSGLDARAAAIVMRTVRNTVDTGRTVVCTIHQPSIDIFEAFDELVLMKRGGQLIYMGPLGKNSQHLVEYFESITGVPKIKDGYNPATWMLEASSPAVAERLGVDFADIFTNSQQYKDNEAMLAELEVPPEGHEDLFFPTRFSTGLSTQFSVNLWKRQLMYWRSPEYNVVRYFFTGIMALLLGSVFFDLGQKRKAQQNVLNIMGALYTASLFIGWNNGASVQPIMYIERTVFYRERAAGYYSAIPYALAQGLIEIPYVTVQTVVYCLIVYAMIHFQWTAPKFFWFMLYTYMTLLYFTYYGMMAISLCPNQQLAMVLSIFFFALWNVASGFIIPRPKMPAWVRWYAWCNPVAWTLYGLVASQLGDVTTPIHQVGVVPDVSVKQYLRNYFDFEHKMLGWVVMVQVAFVILFFMVFAVALEKLNFQKR